MDKYTAPTTCPVCGGDYEITTLTCKKCKSELNGRFNGCNFCQLSENEKLFLTTFIKCRGNIKEVEKDLNISYPTVRNRLDSIITSLGLESSKESAIDTKEERKKIFSALENGEISALDAANMIKNLK